MGRGLAHLMDVLGGLCSEPPLRGTVAHTVCPSLWFTGQGSVTPLQREQPHHASPPSQGSKSRRFTSPQASGGIPRHQSPGLRSAPKLTDAALWFSAAGASRYNWAPSRPKLTFSAVDSSLVEQRESELGHARII